MTDSVLKPAEFRPATNYDTNPYYDTNFDHSVVDPLKQIDGRLDALETTIDTEDTGLSDRVAALEQAGPFLFKVVHPAVESGPMTLDKTYAEFEEALLAGKPIYAHLVDDTANTPDEVYFAALVSIGYVPTDAAAAPYQVTVSEGGGSDEPTVFMSATKNGVLSEGRNH